MHQEHDEAGRASRGRKTIMPHGCRGQRDLAQSAEALRIIHQRPDEWATLRRPAVHSMYGSHRCRVEGIASGETAGVLRQIEAGMENKY